jgi:hypothetical protein
MLAASLAEAEAPVATERGLVSIADGPPFSVIRGDDLRTGTRGVTLLAGDILETGANAFVVIQLQGGRLIAIGPASQVYWAAHGGVTSLAVRRGWLKADLRAAAQCASTRVSGPRMGVQSQQAVVLLQVDETFDAVFDEQGAATLCCTAPASHPPVKETRPGQFLVARQDGIVVSGEPHPSADFLAQMPAAFRDNLPEMPAGPAAKPLEPTWVRKVSYADIQPWLTAQRSWRTGFVPRFRERLMDRTFFAAMDAHLDQHQEWTPVLHPPPPPDGTRAQDRPKPPSQ